MRISALAFAILASVAFTSAPALAETVRNGDFTQRHAPGNTPDDIGNAKSWGQGTRAKRTEIKGDWWMSVTNDHFYETIEFKTGKLYTLFFTVVPLGLPNLTIDLQSYDNPDPDQSKNPVVKVIKTFQNLASLTTQILSAEFTVPEDKKFTLRFTAKGSALFDDVSLTSVPLPDVVQVPGPLAGAGLPALAGLAGFLYARRRKATV